MTDIIRTSLLAALLVCAGAAGGAAFAQDGSAPTPAAPAPAAPTPTEPAETETPRAPAASGGQASDATPDGGPESSAPSAPGTPPTSTDAPAREGPAREGSSGTPAAPRNAVGDAFELPRISDRAQQVGLISELCGVQLKDMPKPACDCLAEKSMSALADPQRDYLIASVVAPPVAERMLKDGRVGQPDQARIFAFLERESVACKADGGSAPAPAPN